MTLADAQSLCGPYPGTHIILGTDGDDTIDGTNQPDCIVAGAGKDRIRAGNGNDIVFAGAGDDDVSGDNGDDTVFAGAGNDRVLGGNGNDVLQGEDGADFINGQNGDDHLFGGAGDDDLYGESGNDVMFGGLGNDRLHGASGDDELHGEDGADLLDGEGGNDQLFGDACHDRLLTSSGSDTVNGGPGTDACDGTACEQSSTTSVCVTNAGCAPAQRCVTSSGVCVSNSDERCDTACVPTSSTDTSCNGVDDDCDGLIDDDYAWQPTSCGIGACARTQPSACVGGVIVDVCTPGSPSSNDAVCNGIDDDCSGSTDEDFVSRGITCGVGRCSAAGQTRCVAGAVQNDCTPGTPLNGDSSCDAIDDDCDGRIDEDFQAETIACGAGACASSGTRSCIQGQVINSCTPGVGAAQDTVCNGVDDDCDGHTDENYQSATTSCGVGGCSAHGSTVCVQGVVRDSCQPGVAAASDSSCDGIDSDCDGSLDEDYTPTPTTCGVGQCVRTGSTLCTHGAAGDSCVPGAPSVGDKTCDGVDDDCDGRIDENYVVQMFACGDGACAATGTSYCNAGHVVSSCTPGTGAASDSVCNGIDDDCDGHVDEDYVGASTACGVGACAGVGSSSCVEGHVVDSCHPGTPSESDATCNGVDDDCDGVKDEDYVGSSTACGTGACASTGSTHCREGVVVDSCSVGSPAATDSSCNGIDDDCDSRADEGYVGESISCGTGACTASGTTNCAQGVVVRSCTPGAATTSDSLCNGIDDDCNGSVDEDFVASSTTCGVGACAATGMSACTGGAVVDSCIPGSGAVQDATCDGIDDDCSGSVDEDYVAMATACGVGACAAVGTLACVNGALYDSCVPHVAAASDATCNGVDDDCDGNVDDDFVGQDTACGIGACAAQGRTSCQNGRVVDSCTPNAAALDDATCDGIDDDCGGARDEDYMSTPTQCGVGVCASTGTSTCLDGVVLSGCSPAPSTGDDSDCDGVDDDCNGAVDDHYSSHQITCGAGACLRTGTTQCAGGVEGQSCTPGAAAQADLTCDGVDDDCDGRTDEEYETETVPCGDGVCAGVMRSVCEAGMLGTTECLLGQPTGDDHDCNALDDDCDGAVDEGFASGPTTCVVIGCRKAGQVLCVMGTVIDSCESSACVAEADCLNGDDDDADGAVDCADRDCSNVAACEDCSDGQDNDGDGFADCQDSTCAAAPGCAHEVCDNNQDDDGDRLADCADPDCLESSACAMIPEDPALTAPPLPTERAATFYEQTQNLFSGDHAVQFGFAPSPDDYSQLISIRGRVLDVQSEPLAAVRVSVVHHPEFGYTFSRADGVFDLVVSGTTQLTLSYDAGGYPNVQRPVVGTWEQYARAPDVVMTPLDRAVTQVELGGQAGFQVARATLVEDDDGERTATVLFPAGVQAQMTLQDDSVVPLPVANVRATEFTVGETGVAAMPAPIAQNTAYTYAVELSADEAIASGAKGIEFSEPVIFYLENFTGMTVGTAAPTGYYDRELGNWIAINNGRVVSVLSVQDGVATLDVDGNGEPADGMTRAALGVTDAELAYLAQTYQEGQSLWRVRIEHFSSYDINWPDLLPSYASYPPASDDPGAPVATKGNVDDGPRSRADTRCMGSVIGCLNRTLGESIPVPGTGMSLEYESSSHSSEAPYNRSFDIPIVYYATVELIVAGRLIKAYASPPAFHYSWDGFDHAGRLIVGSTVAEAQVCHHYRPLSYDTPKAFEAAFASINPEVGGNAKVARGTESAALCRRYARTLTGIAPQTLLRPSFDYWLDKTAGMITRPDGSSFRSIARPSMEVIAGGGSMTVPANGSVAGPLVDLSWNADRPLEFAIDGSLVRMGAGSVDRLTTGGVMQRITPLGLANGPSAITPTGYAYVHEATTHKLLRYRVEQSPSGWSFRNVTQLGGTGATLLSSLTASFPSIRARDARLIETPRLIKALGDRIYMVGCWRNSAGALGDCELSGDTIVRYDPLPATVGELVDVDLDGAGKTWRLYRASDGTQTIYRSSSMGRPADIVWQSCAGESPQVLALAADYRYGGALVVIDYAGERTPEIRQLDQYFFLAPNQFGCGTTSALRTLNLRFYSAFKGFVADGQTIEALGAGPTGNLYAYVAQDGKHLLVRGTRPVMFTNIAPPSDVIEAVDGSTESILHFNKLGQLLDVQDLVTNATKLSIARDFNGRVESVADTFGNQTGFQYGSYGELRTITGPYGHTTTLEYDSEPRPIAVHAPEGITYQFGWGEDEDRGLLTSFTDPRGNTSYFEYNHGRLESDTDAAGGVQTLSAETTNTGTRTVERTDGDNDTYTYSMVSGRGETRTQRSTAPDGTYAETTTDETGVDETHRDPDGTIVTMHLGPDPRWGFGRPVPMSSTTTTASGRSLTTTTERYLLGTNIEVEATTINGRTYQTEYDLTTRVKRFITPLGRVSQVTYDSFGRPVKSEAAGLASSAMGYEPRGRLSQLITTAAPDEQRASNFAYGDDGMISTVSWQGLSSAASFHYTYDGAARVSSSGPAGFATNFGYLGDRLQTVQTPRGDMHTFGWSSVGLNESYQPPEGEPVVTSYTPGRKLNTVQFPSGRFVNMLYEHGHVSGTNTEHRKVRYAYDADTGQLTDIRVLSGGLINTFAYDGPLLISSALAGETAPLASVSLSYDNDWRADGFIIEGSASVSFGYNDDGQVTGVETDNASISNYFDDVTGLLWRTIATDTGAHQKVVTEQQHNAYGEISSYRAGVPLPDDLEHLTELYSYAFSDSAGSALSARDAKGRILERRERVGASGPYTQYTYSYDAGGRLWEVTRDGVSTLSLTYDANGNRLSATRPSGIETGTYNERDELVTYAGRHYVYDEDGSLESVTVDATGQTTTFDYDSLGNLHSVILPNGQTIEYEIDGLNRRVGRRVDGALTYRLLYVGRSPVPVGQLDASGQLVAKYIYSENPRVPSLIVTAGDGNSSVYRVVTDHLGSVRLVVDIGTGLAVQRMDYDEFGNVLADSNPGLQPFGFAGGLYDADTGLVRFGARDYDATTGRWTCKDPILFGGGQANLYLYVGGDPINFIDPTGTDAEGFAIAVGAAVGADIGFVLGGGGGVVAGLFTGGVGFAAVPATAGLGAAGGAVAGALLGKGLYELANAAGLLLARAYDPNHAALRDLVNDVTNRGHHPLSVDDANTVNDWADEYSYPGWHAGQADVCGAHWIGPHINLPGAGRSGHVPVEPGVTPR